MGMERTSPHRHPGHDTKPTIAQSKNTAPRKSDNSKAPNYIAQVAALPWRIPLTIPTIAGMAPSAAISAPQSFAPSE